jgi:hypothetical protein
MKPLRSKYIYLTTPNGINREVFPDIVRRMKSLGPPVLRAVPFPGKRVDHWLALEGSHRVAAAKKLGLVIIIRPMKLSQRIRHDINHGWLPGRTTVKRVVRTLMMFTFKRKYRVAALILH